MDFTYFLHYVLIVFSCIYYTGSQTDREIRHICVENLGIGYETVTVVTVDCQVIDQRLKQSTRCYGDSYFCLSYIHDSHCNGLGSCEIRLFVEFYYLSRRPCYNQLEVECAKDSRNPGQFPICTPGFESIIPAVDELLYISMERTDAGTSTGCELTVDVPHNQLIRIIVAQQDERIFMMACHLTDRTYLYILLKNSVSFHQHLSVIHECGRLWDELSAGVLESNTAVHINAPDFNHRNDYDLILEVSVINVNQPVTETTVTQESSTSTKELIVDEETSKKTTSNSSAVVIAVTVVVCLGIVGVGAFTAVYIYRHPIAKLNELFKASRGLRHRPRVERNIYSAAHVGLSANDVPPPYPAPGVPSGVRHIGRSITGMRLPAIPPEAVNNVLPEAARHALQDQSGETPPQPTAPPASAVSQLELRDLSGTHSSVHDVVLPVPVQGYSDSEESDSDNSDDDKEEIPEHRFSMVRTNSVLERCPKNNESPTVNDDTENNNTVQYVAVDVLNDELSNEETNITNVETINDEEMNLTQRGDTRESFTIAVKEEESPIEYTSIDFEKTHNLTETGTCLENDSAEEHLNENRVDQ